MLASLLLILISVFNLQLRQADVSITTIESLIRSKDYDQALQRTRSALQQAPNDHRLWTLEGIVFSMTNRKPDALNAFDKALRLAPTYRPALQGKVELLYQTLDDRAIPLLATLLKTNPNDQTAHEMYAVLEARQGNCPKAIVHFHRTEKAIMDHPTSLEAYGDCLARTKQPQRAIAAFERLVALRPEETYLKYDLAVLLIESKQYANAVKVLEPLRAAGQLDSDILSLASEAYEGFGDTPKAVALLREAIILSPSTASYYNAFALLCLDHESYQIGIDMIDAGLQRISEASLYLSRGLLYAEEGEYDKAEADFARAEQLDANQGMSSYAADLVQVQKNNPDEALRRVRLQLKAHPDSPLLHYLLAQLLMRKPATVSDTYKEAMKEDARALELKPDLVSARNLMASIHMRAGQYDKAIEECRAALQYAPNDEAATYHLIISLRHAGKKHELQPLVKRLAELHQQSLQNETDRKRYKLVEQLPIPNSGPPND